MNEAMTPLPDAAVAIASFSGAIATDRLVLRPGRPEDAERLFVHYNDFDVVRWLARPAWPADPSHLRDDFVRALEGQAAGWMIYFVIFHGEEPIGGISWDDDGASSHTGYWLGRSHWGKGYMSEAAAALCDLVFATSNATVIRSGVFEGNAPSLRIQHKLGFVETGRSIQYCHPRGTRIPHIDTKLTRAMRRIARTGSST